MAGLRLDGLSTMLLREVDLTLAAGERIFLSGASGSGKSLLLRAVADLDPHRGEVWLVGKACELQFATIVGATQGLLHALGK